MTPGASKIEASGVPNGFLEASWGLLEAKSATDGRTGPPNPALGAFWGALKRSQSGLGAFLAALGDALGLPGSLPGGSEATLGADFGRCLYGASLGCEKKA